VFTLDIHASNIIPAKYRQVAISDFDHELTIAVLREKFIGREAYMRTRFIVVRSAGQTALIEVDRAASDELFSIIEDVRVVAGPDECVYVEDRTIDVGVPSQMARVADRYPGARCVVVEGLYSHVSFLLNPQPFRLNVLDIVPPAPSKLFDQVQRLLDIGEELPPIVLTCEAVDARDLLDEHADDRGQASSTVLLPCRATGVDFGTRRVEFLDQRPTPPPSGDESESPDWTVLGCERTRQIHGWFYGVDAPSVDTCPRRFLSDERDAEGVTMTRCCLLQEGMEQRGRTTVVPWGSTLGEVSEAVRALIASEGVAWTPI